MGAGGSGGGDGGPQPSLSVKRRRPRAKTRAGPSGVGIRPEGGFGNESGSLISEQAMLRKELGKAARAELTGKPRSRESMGRRGARTGSKPRLRFGHQESARGMPTW